MKKTTFLRALLLVSIFVLHSPFSTLRSQGFDTLFYFTLDEAPDAGLYLPAPPDTGSLLFVDDFQQWLWGKSMRNTPRGQQASWESLYDMKRMCSVFGEALGFTISKESTPAIYHFIWRVASTGHLSVERAKEKYMRRRPFDRMNEHCFGAFDDDEDLRGNGSYPSGHTAIGWSTALALAEMAPELQDTILRRGYQYGESRVIVGAHWQSDVEAARLASSTAVAMMRTLPEYRADLAAARQEFLQWHGPVPAQVGYPNCNKIIDAPIDTAHRRYQGDVMAHWLGRAERNTPRGQQAAADAKCSVQDFLDMFSACLGTELSVAETPYIAALLSQTFTTIGNENRRHKNMGFRKRPYVQLNEGTLVPDEEAGHAKGSSYPSSHSALGWGMALVMTEVTADSHNVVLQRGYDYGQSRVIAGYHWASDVQAARLVAICALGRLHNDKDFLDLLDKARAEYRDLKKD